MVAGGLSTPRKRGAEVGAAGALGLSVAGQRGELHRGEPLLISKLSVLKVLAKSLPVS